VTRRAFDRYMVALGMGTHPKLARLTDTERCAHVFGVLAIAAMAPIRGCLIVGELPAEAADVAVAAGVPVKAAQSAIAKLRDIGILQHDAEHDCLRVHDWDDYNPEPKTDRTHAERQRRYRERQRGDAQSDAVTPPVTDTVTTVTVTPPEGEGEEEEQQTAEASPPAETPSLPPQPAPPQLKEARPEAAPAETKRLTESELAWLFRHWRATCRPNSERVTLTDQRAKALRSRASRDSVTFEELKQAIDGAAQALDNQELDYEHHDTELYRIAIDREHVNAWIAYRQTGDYTHIQEMLLAEHPRQAA
jgi:hypothetical protein